MRPSGVLKRRVSRWGFGEQSKKGQKLAATLRSGPFSGNVMENPRRERERQAGRAKRQSTNNSGRRKGEEGKRRGNGSYVRLGVSST